MAERRNVFLCVFLVLACWLVTSCSSSKSPASTGTGTGTGTSGGGLQLTPSSAPFVELTPSGSVSVTVSANQSVTWSVQTSVGYGQPLGASVTPTSGNSTTFTYTAFPQPCSGNPTIQFEVVATSATTPPESLILPINIAQSAPCIAPVSVIAGGQFYTSSCPANGTVITPTTAQLVGQIGVYTQSSTIYAYPIQSSNGGTPYGIPPFTWTLTGSLPNGLTWSTSADTKSVNIMGTPSSVGCTQFQLQVTDATGATSCPVPTGSATCQPGGTPFIFLVLPAALKVQSPPLPFSYDGIPYPPVSLQVTGGTGPYTWSQIANENLPPGLNLTSTANSAFAEISGTPTVGDSNNYNGAGSPNPGQYPTVVQVNDSQSPYPAMGTASLSSMFDSVLPAACSSSAQSQAITPSILNGGVGSTTVSAADYLQGTYAFAVRGFDGKQPTVIAGSLTFNSADGTVAGEEDITQGSVSSQAVPVTGTYTVGIPPMGIGAGTTYSYNRGCVTLTTSAGSTTFDFSLGGCSNNYTEGGAITTSDDACGMTQNGQSENVAAGVFTSGRLMVADDGTGHSAQISGILRAQNASAFAGGLSGPYAFGLGGWDSSGGHYAIAGSVQAGSGSLTSAAADISDAGVLGTQLTGGSGTLAAADANGRIAATLRVGQANFNLALYMISSSDALVVTSGPLSATSPVLTGEALSTSSSFTSTSLRNTHMLAMGGLASPGPDVSIGVLTFNAGAVTGTIYQDQAATLATTSVSAVYSVDSSTGRTPFTAPLTGQSLGAHAFVVYLVPPSVNLTHNSCSYEAACITGFVVGTNTGIGALDATAQDGVLEFQTPTNGPPPPFTNRYVVGDFVYGTAENLDSTSASFEGDVFATPSSSNTTGGSMGGASIAFYQDASYCLPSACPLLIPAETFSGSYSINTTGIGTFGGGAVVAINNGNVMFYIDESPVNTHPSIVVAEQ